jgi:hypothetical protein
MFVMPQVVVVEKKFQQIPLWEPVVTAEVLQLVVQVRKEIQRPQQVLQILVPAVADQDFKMVLEMEHPVLGVVA